MVSTSGHQTPVWCPDVLTTYAVEVPKMVCFFEVAFENKGTKCERSGDVFKEAKSHSRNKCENREAIISQDVGRRQSPNQTIPE